MLQETKISALSILTYFLGDTNILQKNFHGVMQSSLGLNMKLKFHNSLIAPKVSPEVLLWSSLVV